MEVRSAARAALNLDACSIDTQGNRLATNLPSDLLEFVAIRARPCMLLLDGSGRVHDRFCHLDSAVPADIRSAATLDGCLSRPVRDDWIQLIRETIYVNRPFEAVVVVDGIGFDLGTLPEAGEHDTPRAWLSLTQLLDRAAETTRRERRIMQHHEWGRLDLLSRSQLESLRLITIGLSNQQIADRLHRSKRAVEWHTRHLHRLLSVSTREALSCIGRAAAIDCFTDSEWAQVLKTRPARRSLEDFALADRARRAS